MKSTIRLGCTYATHYIDSIEYECSLAEDSKEFLKYNIRNSYGRQLFQGVLIINPNGSARMNAKYVTYSGVKNKYTIYYDENGREIISGKKSDKEEREYYNRIKNKGG